MARGKQFGFKEQLKIGDEGERIFQEVYKNGDITLFEGRDYDFDRVSDGKRIELKTDTYVNSPNFFFERWSDMDRKKPGSVWQSIDKADVFIYFFINEMTYYEFEYMQQLLTTLDDLIITIKPTVIRNRGWTAEGYKVPKTLLSSLYNEVTLDMERNENENNNGI